MSFTKYDRVSSYHEYNRIVSSDFQYNDDLYGEYDNAPPTVNTKDAVDVTDQSASSVSYYAKWFVQKFLSICAKGFAFIFRILFVGFTVFLLFIGSYYLNDCSCQPFIPVYLIVSGCLLFLLIVYALYKVCKPTVETETSFEFAETSNRYRYLKDLLTLFVFAWFIAGSVSVYQIHPKVSYYNVTSDCYCQALLYRSTFWSITSFYIIMAVVLVIGLLGMFVKYLYACFHGEDY